jgi:hypothetical protein
MAPSPSTSTIVVTIEPAAPARFWNPLKFSFRLNDLNAALDIDAICLIAEIKSSTIFIILPDALPVHDAGLDDGKVGLEMPL